MSEIVTMIRKAFRIFLVVGFALACPWAAETSASPKPSILEQARLLLREEKPEEAIALVDPIIAKAEAGEAKAADAICPEVAVAFLAKFMAQRNSNLAVTISDSWCDAMLVKGFALSELKHYAAAAAILGKLVKHDPGNANYLNEYAFALRSSGDVDAALAVYQKAKSLASSFQDKAAKRHWRAVALRGIGFIAFDREQWDEAEKAYRDSLKDDPGSKVALSELELIKERRGK